MSKETVVLITGANRGLGLGLVKLYLAQPNTRVILTARNTTTASSEILDTLPKSFPGTLHGIYKLDSESATDTIALRESLLTGTGSATTTTIPPDDADQQKITKIDIVIANAGIAEPFDTVLNTSIEDGFEQLFRVNTLGPIRLYQQLWKDLLEKSDAPKFVLVSSVLGSLTDMDPSPCAAYGASKVAANYVVRKMHLENERLVAVILQPGWVKTANGHAYADAINNVAEPPLTVEQSVNAIFKTVSEATKDTTSGKFIDVVKGEELPW